VRGLKATEPFSHIPIWPTCPAGCTDSTRDRIGRSCFTMARAAKIPLCLEGTRGLLPAQPVAQSAIAISQATAQSPSARRGGMPPSHRNPKIGEPRCLSLRRGFLFSGLGFGRRPFFIATTLASTALLAACRNWTQARSFQAVFNKNDPRRRALNHKRQAPKEDKRSLWRSL
jgi:hypothetical protein